MHSLRYSPMSFIFGVMIPHFCSSISSRLYVSACWTVEQAMFSLNPKRIKILHFTDKSEIFSEDNQIVKASSGLEFIFEVFDRDLWMPNSRSSRGFELGVTWK